MVWVTATATEPFQPSFSSKVTARQYSDVADRFAESWSQAEAALIIDARADEAQRTALLRILSGQDTEPGATIFNVFASTLAKVHDPIFADIAFEIDIDRRRARLAIPGYVESRGEPILNPVTGAEHRVRIDSPNGFEFRLAEVGRGWSTTQKPMVVDLADSYGHFCELNLCQSGVIN